MRDMERDELVRLHGPYSQKVQDYDAAKREEARQEGTAWNAAPTGTVRPSSGKGWGALAVILLIFLAIGMLMSEPDETDGIRPEGVSQEEFESNPTAGKIRIEKCGSIYKYTVNGRRYGTTFSYTAPHKEVDHIVESVTIGVGGRRISSGQLIPRNQVMPMHGFGNYITVGGEKIHCTDFYYTPPSTASMAERRSAN